MLKDANTFALSVSRLITLKANWPQTSLKDSLLVHAGEHDLPRFVSQLEVGMGSGCAFELV